MIMDQKVVAYLRCSTKGQHESGLGIEAQRSYVKAFCARTGSTMVREFIEVESGRKSDRAILQQAIAFTKRAKGTLVIAKLDRLARSVAFVANLMETSVKFEACDMPGANNMTIHVMSAVAQNEAEAISRRTSDALQALKARGTLLGAHRASARHLSDEARAKGQALSVKANRDKAVSEYADLLPVVLALRSEGRSLREIAKRLTDDGHKTRNDGAWSAVQVKRMIDRVA